MFVSTLPIRMEVDPDCDVLSFVTSIGKEQLSVMRHQKYPYNLLMNELRHQHGDLAKFNHHFHTVSAASMATSGWL